MLSQEIGTSQSIRGNSQGPDPSSVGKMVRILGIALLPGGGVDETESSPPGTESSPFQGVSVEFGDCSPPGIVSADVVAGSGEPLEDSTGSVSPELKVALLVVSNADVFPLHNKQRHMKKLKSK